MPIVEKCSSLPDGTAYALHMPRRWNGTLVRDLDFVTRNIDVTSGAVYREMLSRGYAVAGTARHPLRMYQYDPVREIDNLDRVLDTFSREFEPPRRVIQYGCSGGGHVTLAISENFHARVDGAVALAAHTPVWLMNTFLDGWWALRILIGSDYYERLGYGPIEDLQITELLNDGTIDRSAHGRTGELPDCWRLALDAAQKTSLGRARIALAFTLGQWPAWVNEETDCPDLNDPHALQQGMYHAAWQNAANPGGEARIMFENAAQGRQLSWNADVDYARFFESGNRHFKAAVEALYKEADASLKADLELLDRAPRVQASEYALAFWSKPGRTIKGDPKIPVLRLHMIGDYQIPHSLVQGYEEAVASQGKQDLVRMLLLKATGHCNFNTAETGAAIELMMERLNQGTWPDTSPAAANRLGERLLTGSQPRFFDGTPFRQACYNRLWTTAEPSSGVAGA